MSDDETDDDSADATIYLRYDEGEESWSVETANGCRASVDYWIKRRPGHRVIVKVR